MALSNHERVAKALDLLKDGLRPYVERELKAQHGDKWISEVKTILGDTRLGNNKNGGLTDVAAILVVMDRSWGLVFRRTLGRAERALVNELSDIRNRWAHQEPFSSDDAYRALDSVSRLLTAVSATQADEVAKMMTELQRVRFDEQARTEKRRSTGSVIESQVTGDLKPWREVVTPHRDVASGRYQQAEFAADLWQVHLGEGTDEYRDPVEFFRRTFLTESLQQLLTNAIRRLEGTGGDPVVQLQTNFGGGKTHSMLALYHLFSGVSTSELVGIDAVMQAAEVKKVPVAKRVVLVGNKISPGNPVTKPDGTVVRTLWGELAWQLGFAAGGAKEAKKAFQRIKSDDEKATSPGDALRELFNAYGPCLILVDEWVAYARQLHNERDLPGGTFETHFTFAQALTESAKAAKNCLVVVSLPASDFTGSPHAVADDVEVGGERGREALNRLRNVVGRVESSWRPATAEEGFEIVRRRLFEPLTDKSQFVSRDRVAKDFADLYRTQQQEFPPECREGEYERRLKAAYPIHPEVFDRLYTDWSTLVKFQRTRGVLRLMAAVIHSLWENQDRNPLIMPANIPIDDPRVQFEVTRYLSDNWVPVIEKDVDGPNSLPLRLDREITNLGKYAACRRVARAVYLGSAPTAGVAHRGIEERRIKLGCVMPGEPPSVFVDALRRLGAAATFLYQDTARYWYDTQATVTKIADDRAEQLKSNPDAVAEKLKEQLRIDLRNIGDFAGAHVAPTSSQDVPDEFGARFVVLGPEYPYSKEGNSPAELEAKKYLETRGTAPRICRNTLVFLAVDKTRLQDLDDAVRKHLAWESINVEQEALLLSAHQVKQAEIQLKAAKDTVVARLPEAYQWLLHPTQSTPQSPITWKACRLTGQEALAVRASKKLKNEELLLTSLAGSTLRLELDKVPLWRGDHVEIKQLAQDFARYPYLPRLKNASVLTGAISDGLALLTWSEDTFAYAESFDEDKDRYRGLRCGEAVVISEDNFSGVLVKTDRAIKQRDAESAPRLPVAEFDPPGLPPEKKFPEPDVKLPTRFHGSVVLETARVGRDAGKIADEVISYLAGLVGSSVVVTLEIEAEVPSGAPENVVRTVTENSRTLKFGSYGFERE